MDAVHAAAARDALALARGGVQGVLVENFGDAPFYPDRVPSETVAAMSAVAGRLRELLPARVALGINVLRNDAASAIAIAAAVEAQFIRVNILSGAAVTDQGVIEGRAHEIMRLRARLAPRLAVLADLRVKHARPLAAFSLEEEVADLVERGLADALLFTGLRTGAAPSEGELHEARHAARAHRVPLWLASGATARNLPALAPLVDGVIVGSGLKRGGRIAAPVDGARVARFVTAARRLGATGKRATR